MKIIRNGSNILDIGSNDGTFLNFLTNQEKKNKSLRNRPISKEI